jgi:hypothetical protein
MPSPRLLSSMGFRCMVDIRKTTLTEMARPGQVSGTYAHQRVRSVGVATRTTSGNSPRTRTELVATVGRRIAEERSERLKLPAWSH